MFASNETGRHNSVFQNSAVQTPRQTSRNLWNQQLPSQAGKALRDALEDTIHIQAETVDRTTDGPSGWS